jgi:lipopolysaccharide/colanic/teichoic acid biosynthesis glycosyltransferase
MQSPTPQPTFAARRQVGNQNRAYLVAKRAMDVAGVLVLIVLLSPLILSTLLVLLVTTKGSPFFVQERVGYLGKFRMLNFRTMRLGAHKLQHLVTTEQSGPVFKNRHDPRITRIGRFLPSTTIDELPQLFNVLKGDIRHRSLFSNVAPLLKGGHTYGPFMG